MNEPQVTSYAMPKVGDVLAGKYRLEKVAGEGGMGMVYVAEHLVLRQRVAVKVLLPDAASSEAVVERFSREAQAGARIVSEHVARVLDAGSLASGAPFLVMEYLEGCDLDELLKTQGTLPPSEVADILLQALEALAHAHAVKIVHRDLKPANLFLASRPDGGSVVKMLDFGISKSKARPGEKVLTGQAVLGSPVYMSPEQLRNSKELDGRADLWSLGVVAYELLCGKLPFDGDGVGEIFAAILEMDAQPVCQRNPKVPPELSAVIGRCLARKPEDRWPDAAALARAVAPFGTGAFTPLVDRAEQVLARAKLADGELMPSEARLVVQAIETAARRARETGIVSGGVRALATQKTEVDTTPLPASSRSRSPRARWFGLAAAGVTVVGVVAALAAVRSTRAASAESEGPLLVAHRTAAPPQAMAAASPGAGATGVAEDATSAPAPETLAPEPETLDPEPVMELPATSSPAAARARASKAAKPTSRPKFLNSRE